MKVIVLGGYGVFGGRLARFLLADGLRVIVAGRSMKNAQAFTDAHGGEVPGDVLVDAAGPFQGYADYAVSRLAVDCGCHALDLSDDAAFTTGISDLDAAAKAAGVAVLSGVSTVPALSSAAVEALRVGLDEITLIESAILPGNRAPRGRAVMA